MAVEKIAIPSKGEGGLGAVRSDHFGHCDIFTILEVADGEIKAVGTHDNIAHEAGGCMVPVKVLADAGVDAIVVGGIGARPLQGFAEVGVKVYFASREQFMTVQDVATVFIENGLPEMQPGQACKGGSNCHN